MKFLNNKKTAFLIIAVLFLSALSGLFGVEKVFAIKRVEDSTETREAFTNSVLYDFFIFVKNVSLHLKDNEENSSEVIDTVDNVIDEESEDNSPAEEKNSVAPEKKEDITIEKPIEKISKIRATKKIKSIESSLVESMPAAVIGSDGISDVYDTPVEGTNVSGIGENKYTFMRKEVDGAFESGEIKTGGTSSLATPEPVIVSPKVTTETREPVIIASGNYASGITKGAISALGFYDAAQVENLVNILSNGLKSQLFAAIDNVSSSVRSNSIASTQMIALSNKIDHLENATISGLTVTGVTGLTDADIPDTITVSGYLPTTGGNITGNFGVGTTSPYAPLSVEGAIGGSYFVATDKTAASSFINASSSLFTVTGSTWLGTLSGPLQATNGLVSSTSTLSVAYGGTGLSALPSYGQLLIGDNAGGYSFVSTSSLGILSTFSTTSSDSWVATYDKGYFYSTTSADNWKTQNNFYSTTSTDHWKGQNNFFSTTSANFYIDASSTIPALYKNNGWIGLNTFDNASTSLLTVSGKAWLGTVATGTWNGDVIGTVYGGTGINSYSTGDILYSSGANTLAKLSAGMNGQVLKLSGGVPAWGSDLSGGGGGGGSGVFATTSNDLAIYPTDPSDVVIIGSDATTTTGYIFEVVGESFMGSTTMNNLTVTNLSTSTFVGGVSLSGGCFSLNGVCLTTNSFSTTSADWWAANYDKGYFFSTTSANAWSSLNLGFSTSSSDYWKTQNNFFSTTSADHWSTLGYGFSTTSANAWSALNLAFSTSSSDYWKTQNNFFSTTSANAWSTLGYGFSTTSADHWISLNGGSSFSTTSADAWSKLGYGFSTTSANHWSSLNLGFSTTSATFFANASTTIPKTYTDNTFTGLNIFANASTTQISASSFSYLGTVRSGTWNGTTIGDSYITKTGAWTGTFDGLEGTDYIAGSFSTTSADAWSTLGYGFSTTSADHWISLNGGSSFSTTSANHWYTLQDHFSTTSAIYFANASTTIPKTYTANTFTALQTFPNVLVTGSTTLQKITFTNATGTNATTTDLAVTGRSSLGTVVSGTWNGSTVGATFGGTGLSSYSTGQLLYADSPTTLDGLNIGGEGTYLKVSGGVLTWSSVPTGGGGSGVSPWATSSDNLAIYPVDPSDVVVIGGSATSSLGTIFEVTGDTRFDGDLLVTGKSTTTDLIVSGNSTLGTVISGLWNGTAIGDSYITKSGAWTGTFDGLEGTDYIAGSFSTTSANHWSSLNLGFSTTSATFFANASTTIPKTYTDNTFTGLNIFANASTTQISASSFSYLGTVRSGTWNGTTIGDSYITKTGAWTGTFDGLEGADYIAGSFSTTSANHWSSLNLGFSTTSATYFANASTTIPKTYTDNTFTGLNIFANASTTQISASGFSYLGTVRSGTWNGTTIGDTYITKTGAWTGTFDGLEGADYIAGSFSTTSANHWSSLNLGFSTTSATFFANASTTIPKTYTANAFTALQTFTNATATQFSVTGSTWLDTLTGPLQAIGGLVSSSSTLSVAYGGTGTSSLPTYGQLLIGNNSGGYTFTSTSTLGLSGTSQWTVSSGNIFFNTGNVGIGTTTPYSKLAVVGQVVASYFTATTTSATSTFANFTATGNASTTNLIVSNTFEGAGLTSCSATSSKLMWNSTTKQFTCGVDHGTPLAKANSATDSQTLSATNLLVLSTAMSPSVSSAAIRIDASVQINSGANTDDTVTVTLVKGYVCGANVLATRTKLISLTSTTGVGEGQVSFAIVNSPATTASTTYSICAASTGTAHTVTNRDILIQEVDTIGAADLAEIYPTDDTSIESGDIVSLDSETGLGVVKSEKNNENQILGVVSTKPALLIGGTEGEGISGIPVALSGRVPVKVTTENGRIKKGDNLILSSVPGVAMKAKKSGNIIGTAITGYDGESVGTITMFVKNSYYGGNGLGEMASSTSLSDENFGKQILARLIEEKDIMNAGGERPDISEIFTDRIASSLEIISPKATFGGLTVDSIGSVSDVVKFLGDTEFFGRPYFNSDTAGFAVIKSGARKVEVLFEREFVNEPIVNASISTDESFDSISIESLFLGDIKYAVTNRSSKGFTVVMNRTAKFDVKFSWMALAVRNSKTFSSRTEDVISPINSEQTASVSSSSASGRDTVPPKIILNGVNPSRVKIGFGYSDMGATVTDNKENNLEARASTWKDGKKLSDNAEIADTSVSAVYEIRYNATDQEGNAAAEVIRTVIIGEEETGGTATTTLSIEPTEEVEIIPAEISVPNEGGVSSTPSTVLSSDIVEEPVSSIQEESTVIPEEILTTEVDESLSTTGSAE